MFGDEHISFTTTKIGSLLDVEDSKDPDGLRVFYYLIRKLGLGFYGLWFMFCGSGFRDLDGLRVFNYLILVLGFMFCGLGFRDPDGLRVFNYLILVLGFMFWGSGFRDLDGLRVFSHQSRMLPLLFPRPAREKRSFILQKAKWSPLTIPCVPHLFFCLSEDLKCLVFSVCQMHFKIKPI